MSARHTTPKGTTVNRTIAAASATAVALVDLLLPAKAHAAVAPATSVSARSFVLADTTTGAIRGAGRHRVTATIVERTLLRAGGVYIEVRCLDRTCDANTRDTWSAHIYERKNGRLVWAHNDLTDRNVGYVSPRPLDGRSVQVITASRDLADLRVVVTRKAPTGTRTYGSATTRLLDPARGL